MGLRPLATVRKSNRCRIYSIGDGPNEDDLEIVEDWLGIFSIPPDNQPILVIDNTSESEIESMQISILNLFQLLVVTPTLNLKPPLGI